MAHLHPLVRAIPLVMALAFLPACERHDVGGDPRVDGITQTPLPEPDLSILGDQKARSGGRTPAVAPPSSATATTTISPEATTTAGTMSAPSSAPAAIPESIPAPTQPATAVPPTPPGGG